MSMGSKREEDELEGYYYDPRPSNTEHGPDSEPKDVRARETPGAGDSSAYWRRRFLILAAGIAALGLCAWLIPGGHESPKTSAAARQSAAAQATRNTLPAAAYGPAYEAHVPIASTKPSPTVTMTATRAAKKPVIVSSPDPDNSATASASGGTCLPRDIVLSLFTTAPSYPQDALPTFDVYAVSTSATACTLVYGAGAVQVVVTDQGHVVWNSAACKPQPGSPVRLTLGVPEELTVSWNRQAAKPPGCGGSLPAGASGTFDVVATTAGQSSPVRAFSLEKS